MARGRYRRLVKLVALGVVLVLGALYVWHLRSEVDRVIPPAEVTDLRTFLLHMPRPERGYEVTIDGSRYIVLDGPLPALSTLPSGPPAYVFDGAGKLIDWTADQGEDPSFIAQWQVPGERKVNAEELDELLTAISE